MTRKTTRIKAPYQVDVLTLVLVSGLVLFGLITLINVFCDPFDEARSLTPIILPK